MNFRPPLLQCPQNVHKRDDQFGQSKTWADWPLITVAEIALYEKVNMYQGQQCNR